MTPEGYVEYKRREFCKDVKCPVQLELNQQTEGSVAYERTRQKCGVGCLYTTWQFHHWLIEKGYIILVNSQLKNNQATLLANIDKEVIDWVDEQVKAGKFRDRSQLVETAIAQFKETHDTRRLDR